MAQFQFGCVREGGEGRRSDAEGLSGPALPKVRRSAALEPQTSNIGTTVRGVAPPETARSRDREQLEQRSSQAARGGSQALGGASLSDRPGWGAHLKLARRASFAQPGARDASNTG